jgi:hypothetical protein
MNDFLTMAEIESRYPSEWVLIDEPQLSPLLQVQGGKVLWHSKDRDEVHRKAIEFRPKTFSVRYTGTIPDNVAVIL